MAVKNDQIERMVNALRRDHRSAKSFRLPNLVFNKIDSKTELVKRLYADDPKTITARAITALSDTVINLTAGRWEYQNVRWTGAERRRNRAVRAHSLMSVRSANPVSRRSLSVCPRRPSTPARSEVCCSLHNWSFKIWGLQIQHLLCNVRYVSPRAFVPCKGTDLDFDGVETRAKKGQKKGQTRAVTQRWFWPPCILTQLIFEGSK